MTTTTRELIEGHYEVREVPYGKVHRWGPGRALVECDCGQAMIVEETTATCPRCGANYTDVVREPVRKPLRDEETPPEYRECLFSGLKAKNDVNRLLGEFYGD